MMRKKMTFIMLAMVGLVAFFAGMAFSSASGETQVSADEALQKLMEGNRHYVDDKLTYPAASDSVRRKSLANSQKPYAVILTCSDSRVPPEIIFDKGLGELFVIRVAGNIPDSIVIGSIEYAVEHLGSSLVMVLGHERCGAVTAAVESNGQSTGSEHIDAIVRAIDPGLQLAKKHCDACTDHPNCAETKKNEFVECVSDASARHVAAMLPGQSKILKDMVAAQKIKIVAAKYDLDDGTVTLFR